jgi:hypothetical protein
MAMNRTTFTGLRGTPALLAAFSAKAVAKLAGWSFTVDGANTQLECTEADWGSRAAEIHDAKLVLAVPSCAEADIENTAEVERNVAVIARGTCSFTEKVQRAVAAGAIAVIVTNNDQDYPDEIIRMHSEGGPEGGFEIPVLGVSYNTGTLLSTAAVMNRKQLRGTPALLTAFSVEAVAKLLQQQFGATGLGFGWEWFLEGRDSRMPPAAATTATGAGAAAASGGASAAVATTAAAAAANDEMHAKLMADSTELG